MAIDGVEARELNELRALAAKQRVDEPLPDGRSMGPASGSHHE